MSSNANTEQQKTDHRSGRVLQRLGVAVVVLGVLWLLASSFVLVDETEFVLVERLGDISAVYDTEADRGFHLKWPWPVETVRRFDRRVQLFDPPGREIFTRDKKNIVVDSYVCWKIAEPGESASVGPAFQPDKPGDVQSRRSKQTDRSASSEVSQRPVVRFFRGLGSAEIAEARLDSRVRSILSTNIGQVELSNLLSVEDSEAGPDPQATGRLERLAEDIRRQVIQRPGEEQSLQQRLGIEIVDVRLKRINLPSENQQSVFERMKSERQKIADRYRSAGMAENTRIKSRADRQYNAILAKARSEAERIRGEAEAEAAAILNEAHARDREFYRMLRRLDSYRRILNENTTLVLSASSNLLNVLTAGTSQLEKPSPAVSRKEKPAAPAVAQDGSRTETAGGQKNDEESAASGETP